MSDGLPLAFNDHYDSGESHRERNGRIPEWLLDRADKIRHLVAHPEGMDLFRKRVHEWAKHRSRQSKAVREWEAQRHKHELVIRKCRLGTELRDQNANPPKAGWEFDYYVGHFTTARACSLADREEFDIQYRTADISGWTPPEFLRENSPSEYEPPLPLTDRTLITPECYVVLAAIHDAVVKGVEAINPWRAVPAPEDRRDAVRFYATRSVYRDLVEAAAQLPETDRVSVDALIDTVANDANTPRTPAELIKLLRGKEWATAKEISEVIGRDVAPQLSAFAKKRSETGQGLFRQPIEEPGKGPKYEYRIRELKDFLSSLQQ